MHTYIIHTRAHTHTHTHAHPHTHTHTQTHTHTHTHTHGHSHRHSHTYIPLKEKVHDGVDHVMQHNEKTKIDGKHEQHHEKNKNYYQCSEHDADSCVRSTKGEGAFVPQAFGVYRRMLLAAVRYDTGTMVLSDPSQENNR